MPIQPPEPILSLEAFGTLSEGTDMTIINTEDEDLHSVFRERAELMGWLNAGSTGSGLRHNRLWSMHEAELTIGGREPDVEPVRWRSPIASQEELATRIGWIQVGLEVSVDPALAMPALVQCFHDSLARFGVVELTGLQISARYLQPSARSYMWFFIDVSNWFNVISKNRVNVSVTFDADRVERHSTIAMVSDLQRRVARPAFEFKEALSSSEISVTMSEWTPSAIGYVIGIVIDAIRSKEPNTLGFTIGITRINPCVETCHDNPHP